MKKLNIPAFGEADFIKNRENETAEVTLISGADAALFARYCTYLASCGFTERESREQAGHAYAAFSKDTDAVFLNYFAGTAELVVECEAHCRYFDYADTCGPAVVSPQITQLTLEDFGMSYAIRLSDGRFIVIDGGREFEPDAKRLYDCLVSGSGGKRPVIAAWILSHPHSDHFHCFIKFFDLFGDKVDVEKVLYHFPAHDDFAHYPKLANKETRFTHDTSPYTNIPMMQERVEQLGAKTYMPHTGQIYRIGDAVCEILSTLGDTIHCSDNINATSLVVRMELAGQVILWATDASFSIARLPERYGRYLKADILQVPHHGFQSGTAAGEIAGYDLIEPSVCLLPVADYHAYTSFCSYRAGTRHIMCKDCVKEMITGTVQRTLTLPYTPSPDAKYQLERNYLTGRDDTGARTWIFSELHTARPEDFVFTLLNATHVKATVMIELFFEDPAQKILYIKAELGAGRLKKLSVIGDEVDSEWKYFNWQSLQGQGIPENVPFAVRFLSDLPIVVSHKEHQPSYRSTLNM
ncbi:MAG: MBL fold metallo-hydrolase [Clostridia bacterium]|nr:MBL fold metallo-hydrolase [Clostridia bacterium]